MSKKTITKNKLLGTANNNRYLYGAHKDNSVPTSFHNLILYRLVYTSRVSAFAVFLLLLSFIFQGAQISFAAELSDEQGVVDESVSNVSTQVVEASDESEELIDEEFLDNTEESGDLTVVELLADSSTVEGGVNDVSKTEEVGEPDEAGNGLLSEELSSGEIDTNLDNNSDTEADIDDDLSIDDSTENATTTSDNEVSDETSSSTEELQDEELLESQPTTEVVSVTNSAAVFSFNQNQCTELASGSFYCHKENINVLKDALFAAPDDGGDMEVFMVKDGEQAQITNNNFDDLAPYFDKNSNSIVWHRFINDRYQIISYDLDSQTESQLTRTNENNMEPTRQGKYTVWQRWIDGGWNIILHDGEEEKQLTKTAEPDVAPYVHGSLVVWNRHNVDGEKTIEMYDITSETFVSVNDPDGLSVSNPRMVFVYDSLHPNGDVVTKGYDVLSHEFIDLDTLPRGLPTELPDNDTAGETKALIQSKPSLKSEVEESMDEPNPVSPPPAQNSTSTTESAGDLTLDLSNGGNMGDVLVVATSSLPLPEYDLVIEPYINATTSGEGV